MKSILLKQVGQYHSLAWKQKNKLKELNISCLLFFQATQLIILVSKILKYPAKSSVGGRCGRTITWKVLYSERVARRSKISISIELQLARRIISRYGDRNYACHVSSAGESAGETICRISRISRGDRYRRYQNETRKLHLWEPHGFP